MNLAKVAYLTVWLALGPPSDKDEGIGFNKAMEEHDCVRMEEVINNLHIRLKAKCLPPSEEHHE